MTCHGAHKALLRVDYNITRDEWANSRSYATWLDPFISIYLGDYYPKDRTVYEYYSDLTDYETCVPREKCWQVIVGGLPTDGYKVSFDGEEIEIGNEFFYDGLNPVTSTYVGNCTAAFACDEREALFELQYWSGDSLTSAQFRVENEDGTTILGEELDHDSFKMVKSSACLPKSGCYTFLIGSRGQTFDPIKYPPSSYSVYFDGQLIRQSDGFLFDSVQLGDSCSPFCNVDESLVEFFMYDDDYYNVDKPFNYEWNLQSHSLSSPSAAVSGVVTQGPGINPLSHKMY